MQKTELDILNEKILKQKKQREHNLKYMSNPSNRAAWNEYQARYARERRATDPEYHARTNAAKTRYYERKKAGLVNS